MRYIMRISTMYRRVSVKDGLILVAFGSFIGSVVGSLLTVAVLGD